MQSNRDDFIKIPQGFWESIKRVGISSHELIEKANLPIYSIFEEPFIIKRSQYLAIWQIYEQLTGDPSKAIIQLVNAYETSKYPPSFMAIYHSSTYREAIEKMVKYKKLCPPENISFQEKGDKAYIDIELLYDETLPAVLVGSTLASILEVGRRGTGLDVHANLIELTYSLDDAQALESYFGCKVKTQSSHNRLTLKRSDLKRPFVSSNDEVLSMLIPGLNRDLSKHQNHLTLTEHVKYMLEANLSNEEIGIETVSKMMNTGSRTLQRQLNLEGTSFKQLIMQTRHEKSLEYLTYTSFSIKEIAFLVGYTDQNSFYRAFRMWENDTPTNWRRNLISH